MNNTFSLQQTPRISNLDASLISRQYKLNLMADFMRLKYENPKLKQSETANQLSYSSSTLQRNINDINLLSPYRNQSNNTNKRIKKASSTIFDNNSHRYHDLKRPQTTSNGLVKPRIKSSKRNKNTLKGGSVHENIEINEHYLDENLHKNDIKTELAMQIISKDKTVRGNTVKGLKEFNS